MLKKTITYTDFNDIEQTEDFYFNLSKSELTRMEMRETTIHGEDVIGGLQNMLNGIIASGSGRLIIDTFEDLIKQSYGVRSEDGKRFIKNEEVYEEFRYSQAYDEFFMELVTDANAGSEFVNAIVPKDISGETAKNARPAPQDYQSKKPTSNLKSVSSDDMDVEEYSAPEPAMSDAEKSELEELRELRRQKAEEAGDTNEY